MGWLLFFSSLIILVVVIAANTRSEKKLEGLRKADANTHAQQVAELQAKIETLIAENAGLAQYKEIQDASLEATRIRQEAQQALDAASGEAVRIRQEAENEAATIRRDTRATNAEAKEKATQRITEAHAQAERLIQDAERRAEEIAGNAWQAFQNAAQLEQTAIAMRNVIEGYGDQYLKPTYSLLDQLAEDYGFDEAGQELKQARSTSKTLVNAGRAASCNYVERQRRETACRFVLDAFNGKTDTILARVRQDNFGILEQQIRDAFSLVNHNGGAFRNARITEEYLASRLNELKWAAAATALRERDREQQRQIREQMREEERARREIERALREAAREEEALQRAMAKVQAQVARANEEQRAMFEAQLAELQTKLLEAEEKNQRALSMAQQTKAGHVYVISNIGSFGENVFKVGMTRRLEPNDRVRELGDASVPFPFDVHAMIWAEDAPALEHALHKRFLAAQINKVNPRKEFFRIPLSELKQAVEEEGLKATWTLAAEASQYRETLAIEQELLKQSPEASAWIRHQMEVTEGELATEEVSTEVA